MSTIRPSTLSESDVALIQSTYGDDYTAMIEDLKNGSIEGGVTEEDLLAWVLENQGSSSLDPDDPALAELWQDAEVQTMLTEFRDLNRSNSDLEALIADVEAYLAVGGVPTDVMNDAARVISEYTDEFGPLMYSEDSDSAATAMTEEWENLLALFANVDPGMYLLIKVITKLLPLQGDVADITNDKYVEIAADIDDQLSIIEGADIATAEGQADIEGAKSKMQIDQQMWSGVTEFKKAMDNLVENTIQMSSGMISVHGQTQNTIAQNIRG